MIRVAIVLRMQVHFHRACDAVERERAAAQKEREDDKEREAAASASGGSKRKCGGVWGGSCWSEDPEQESKKGRW